jgi:pimeloyl-ACP methyl ester carboxylesterase
MPLGTVDRGFVRITDGLVHYRTSAPDSPGSGVPLYLAHSGPGSSRGLAPLVAELGLTRRVIAPDMLGYGDSDPPSAVPDDLGFYADCAVRILDALQIDRVDFYGAHTGAQIGCELAVRHTDRVRRLVLDGIPVFPGTLRAELLERYAPQVTPDDFGGHLAWAWNFVRDLTLHFPHYARDPAHRLHQRPVPPAEVLQFLVVDLLKALPTYHLSYRAAFLQDVAARLPLVDVPTLLIAIEGDPLAIYLDEAASLAPAARKSLIARDRLAATLHHFLEA